MSQSADWATLSGRITRACLDNGMSMPDACETAAVVLPVLSAWLTEIPVIPPA